MRMERIDKVRHVMERERLDALLLKGMENIFYLSGFRGSEGSLLVTAHDTVLLTDFRYITDARASALVTEVVELSAGTNVLPELCARHKVRRLGFDSIHVTYDLFRRLQETLDGIELVPVGLPVEEIRKRKDGDEIALIEKAVAVATDAFLKTLDMLVQGSTEKELAAFLDYGMRKGGAEQPSFETIVASGYRAALPHAVPTDRKIGKGETIIFDFGAQVDGYCSDETCTVSIGRLDDDMEKIFTIVNDARKFGIDAVKAGVPVKDVDMVVRGHIEKHGYGDYFRHSTGHGVGAAVHEAPAINSLAEGLLAEGMVVTIEPGVYIPGKGGVRLEDLVLVEESGARVLTKIRKDAIHLSI